MSESLGSVVSSVRGVVGEGFDAFVSYSHAGDELLAPRVQGGLQRFAKPWWRRRALRVFRDEASLSANPHLWSSITEALDGSGWFVLMLSPEAAGSEWVNREVEYWVKNKDPARILPVVTDGSFVWNPQRGDIDPERTDVAPPALYGVFADEPRWVDLRWARDETDLDLRNARFRAAVADLASAVRGVPKDELESEEVRQHRRTIRTAWGAGVALVVLTVFSVVAALVALDQRDEAEVQRLGAEREADRAESEARRAEVGEEAALAAEALARSRELAAAAINVLGQDPELSILLALEAMEVAPPGEPTPVETVSALREAVHTSSIVRREQIADDGFVTMALSPDGMRLAVASAAGESVRLFDTETWETIWEYREPDTIDSVNVGEFSPDGQLLHLFYVDSTSPFAEYVPPEGAPEDDGLPSRVVVVEAETGSEVARLEYPECPTTVGSKFSPDGRHLAVLTGTDAEGGWCFQWWIELIDTTTWTVDVVIPLEWYSLVNWSESGDRLVLTTPGTVIDVATLTPIGDPEVELNAAFLSPDGSQVVGIFAHDWHKVGVFDVETGGQVNRFTDLDFPGQDVWISPDGSDLIVITGGAETLVWDLEEGKLLQRLPATGAGAEFAYDPERRLLYHGGWTGELTVWDLGGRGEFDSLDTRVPVALNSVRTSPSLGAFGTSPLAGDLYVRAFDVETGEVYPDQVRVWHFPSVLPDGRVVVTLGRGSLGDPEAERGPVAIWDPSSSELTEVAGCWALLDDLEARRDQIPCTDRDGMFTFYGRSHVDPGGGLLLVNSPTGPRFGGGTGEILLYGLSDLAETHRLVVDGLEAVREFGSGWAVVTTQGVMWVLDLEDGSRLLDLGPDSLGVSLAQVGLSPDGDLLAWTDLTGGFTIVDTSSWEPVMTMPEAHTGRTSSLAFSHDGSNLKTAGTDGLVKVWDIPTESEVARIPLADVSDGYWIDDDRIRLVTDRGLWTTVTLDVEELRSLARARLTRGFTEAECTAYRIDCP